MRNKKNLIGCNVIRLNLSNHKGCEDQNFFTLTWKINFYCKISTSWIMTICLQTLQNNRIKIKKKCTKSTIH